MAIPSDEAQLTELFSRLGARDPASWARSQSHEGINQLHRYLFLRQAWTNVIREDDHSWMDEALAATKSEPSAAFVGIGAALTRLLGSGAAREDLAELVRGMQAQLLFNLCHLLDDPGLVEREVSDVGWTLVETNQQLEPTDRVIQGLYESVLDTDPTGREMRPRVPPKPFV